MNIESAIDAALRNIAKFSDTDIFPRPFEAHTFFDQPEECKQILLEVHKNFDDHLASSPPFTIEALTQVGYTGFRWVTQIEPFWNAYYLALVLSIAELIENQRIPTEENTVFSYRFDWTDDQARVFRETSWKSFRALSTARSQEGNFVVLADIADFYPRVNHHRIENFLRRLPAPGDTAQRIMKLLEMFSKNVSYGLPIGGPASRILAELALNPVDQHLFRRRVRFCRYADDYRIFCDDKAEAYKTLVLLSDKLFNEGLSLQKTKTRILTTTEFLDTFGLVDGVKTDDDQEMTDEQKLLNISIRFDPYSPTANEDYDSLRDAISEVDILGILGREVAKTAIDSTVTKQAISAIRALDEIEREGAIRTILDPTNLPVLAPVFITIMRAVRDFYDGFSDETKSFVDQTLTGMFENRSHLLSVELNLSYYIQAIGCRHNEQKEEILVSIFEKEPSSLIRRQIILTMGNWKCHYWLTDIRRKYSGLGNWEKRAFILTSYVLGDEGRHWRRHTKKTWSETDLLIRDWFADRFVASNSIPT